MSKHFVLIPLVCVVGRYELEARMNNDLVVDCPRLGLRLGVPRQQVQTRHLNIKFDNIPATSAHNINITI